MSILPLAFPASAERGGPVGRWRHLARAAMGAAAPRFAPAESSPVGVSRRARFLALVAFACLAAGLWSAGSGAYIVAKAHVAQWLLDRAWQRSRDSGTPVKPWPWADTHPVARLTAPRAGATRYVLAGASGRTLAFGPGHLDGSALPGASGNSVVTGHRDTHFRFLADLGVDDELIVETPKGGRTYYRVAAIRTGDHRDLRLPRDTPAPTLTLVTCYPFDAVVPGGPLRYVVVAEEAGSEPPRPPHRSPS